jgi:hypothetical protein
MPARRWPEYRFADELRRAFKKGEDWTLIEPPQPPALPPAQTVVIEAAPQAHGPDESKRSLSEDLNDVIPF